MPANPSPELYLLVKSLTDKERKFCHTYIRNNSRSDLQNALDLLDALEKSDKHNEEALCKANEDKPFTNHLSYEKNRLTQKLIEALRAYREKHIPSEKVRIQLEEARVLFDHGLNQACKKALKKARKKAVEIEADLMLVEILHFERLLTKRIYGSKVGEELEAIQKEKAGLFADMDLKNQLQDLSDCLFLLIRKKLRLRSGEDQEKLKAIQASPLLEHPPASGKRSLAMLYTFCQAQIYLLEDQVDAAFNCSQELIELFNDHPYLAEQHPTQYRLTLANFLHIGSFLNDYTHFPSTLEKLRAIPVHTKEERMETFQSVEFLEFLWLMNTLQLDEAVAMISRIQKGLDDFGKQMVPSIWVTMHYNLTILFFMLENYDQALAWMAPLLKSRKANVRIDLVRFLKLLHVILTFHAGDPDLVYKEQTTLYRSLSRANQLFPFEKLVLSFLKKLSNSNQEERPELFHTFYGDLEEMKKEPGFKTPTGFFETYLWARSQWQQQPLKEAFREFIARQTVHAES